MKASIDLFTGAPPRPGGRCLPGSRGSSLLSKINLMMITIIFMIILIMTQLTDRADGQEGGNPRQRLRALFNRRRAESAGSLPGNDNVSSCCDRNFDEADNV